MSRGEDCVLDQPNNYRENDSDSDNIQEDDGNESCYDSVRNSSNGEDNEIDSFRISSGEEDYSPDLIRDEDMVWY